MGPLIVWTGLLLLASAQAGLLDLLGPFDLTLKRLEKCPDQGTGQLLFQTRIKKLNRYQYVYSSPWTLPYAADKNLGISITVYKWGLSGWYNTGYTFSEKDACATAQKMVPATFNSVMKAVKWSKGCPLPAGNYTVDKWVLSLQLEVAKLPYGEFRLDGAVMRGRTRLGCVRVFIDVTQKLSQR